MTDPAPIFVVGCQRSGTTALTVMLDRHPAISSMPETQFFYSFVAKLGSNAKQMDRKELVEAALADEDIASTGLSAESVEACFTDRSATVDGLFLALLEAHSRSNGGARPCEKSCHHLFVAPRLLEIHPEAKIIAIVRDGRDVVDSLRRASWGAHFPERVCAWQWNEFARAARRFADRLPSERFTIVTFEDLMQDPDAVLCRLMDFLGESFDPAQLEGSGSSAAVPEQEREWKDKATAQPDAARVEAWRRWDDDERLRRLSWWMRLELEAAGYDASPARASLVEALAWEANYLPLRRPLVGLSRALWRIMRAVRAKS